MPVSIRQIIGALLLVVIRGATGLAGETCPEQKPVGPTVDDELAIANLMADYASRLEARDYGAFGCLFARGALLAPDGTVLAQGSENVTTLVKTHLGTEPEQLLVRRLITNLQIEVDRAKETATARSYLTTLYVTPGKPPYVHRLAHYNDSFRKFNGMWWFISRQEVTDWLAP